MRAGRQTGAAVPFGRVFWRSLSLQASWNMQRMQNLGLLFAMLPWLRGRGLTREETRRFCRRHYGYFNTNPYFANFLLGGLLRLEEKGEASGESLRRIESYKSSLGRVLAALGDQLFWLGLQPAMMTLAALAALGGDPRLPLILPAVFATGQLVLRRRSLEVGYRLGLDMADLLGSPGWHLAIRIAKRAGSLLAGIFVGVFLVLLVRGGDGSLRPGAPAAFAAALVLCVLGRRRLPGEALYLLLALLALALAHLLP